MAATMNEHLHVGPHGLRLLKQWEAAWGAGVPTSLNGAALKAYVCPGGKMTLGWGCTEWPDGSPVKRGETLQNEEQAEALLSYNLIRFEDAVKHLVTVPLTQHQFDAHVGFAFNIGINAYAESSALDATNEGNPELAASKFGLFTGATTTAPTRNQVLDPAYADCIGEGISATGKTVYFWIGPEEYPEQPLSERKCGYMSRLSGLLSRHYSEGLLSLGFDWSEACKPGAISLRTTPPEKRKWNAGRRRWEDGTLEKTDFAKVLAVARNYPLTAPKEPEDAWLLDANVPFPEQHEDPGEYGPGAEAPEPSSPPAPVQEAPVVGLEPQVAPAVPVPAVVGTKPLSPNTKAPEAVPYKVDTTAGAKPLEESERFVGSALMLFATVLRSAAKNTRAAAGFGGMAITGFLAAFDNPDTRVMMIAGTAVVVTTATVWISNAVHKQGLKTKQRAELEATQLLY